MKKSQMFGVCIAFVIGLIFILHAQEMAWQAQSVSIASQVDSIVSITAEAQGLAQVARADLPSSGTFWLVIPNGMAPLPCPPSDTSLPVYQIADGQFLVDASGGQVSVNSRQAANSTVTSALEAQASAVVNLIERVQEAQFAREMMTAFGMEEELDSPSGFSPMFASYDPDSLYLEITNVSNGWSYLNLHNGTNQVYAIWGTTNLLTGWQVERELWPTNSEVMPFTVPTLNRQNLFVRAEDWTGVDSNADGIPDWWAWKYFGDVNQSATNDYDGDGVDNYDEFLNDTDPNKISFTVRLGNQHFNNANATGSFLVLGGVPSYEAVLVNDNNYSNAVWQPYDGAVHLDLGATDGVYQVSIGLKGLADDSQLTWMGTTVYLDRVPPSVTITNPVSATVTVPYVQLQGFADESLQSVTFDVSNAVGVITNQAAQRPFAQFFNTNTFEYTTDYFQCYDVLLTNGLNTITVRTTDLAGNVTTTNVNVTLDYSLATNPAVQLTWPRDGMQVCGNSFTVRGWVDDSTAGIAAQITYANGGTNIITGLVERTGVFWVSNLPLNAGTNAVTLWVTNAAGLASVTNFSVIKSDMVLTLTGINGNLWLPTVGVSGNISDASAAVWVNGVQGTNNGNGTWNAVNVPVSPGGVASFDVTTIPLDAPDPDISTNINKPDEMITESAAWGSTDWSGNLGGSWGKSVRTGTYSATCGGSYTDHETGTDTNGVLASDMDYVTTIAPDWSPTGGYMVDHMTGITTMNSGWVVSQPHEQGSLSYQYGGGWIESKKHAQVKRVYHMGGTGSNGQKVLVAAGASGVEETGTPPYGDVTLAMTDLTLGDVGQAVVQAVPTDWAYAVKAAGSPVNITASAPVPMLNFMPDGAQKYTPTITANDVVLDPDNVVNGADFCVGQGITFDISGLPGGFQFALASWTLPGTFVNTNSDPNCDAFYDKDTSLLVRSSALNGTLSTFCWYVLGVQPATASVTVFLSYHSGNAPLKFTITGKFNVHRPSTTFFYPDNDGNPTVMVNNNLLALGNGRDRDMSFKHQINSGNFSGHAGYTQLLSGEVQTHPNPLNLIDGTELDTREFPRGEPAISANSSDSATFWDGPYVSLADNATETKQDLNFSTYLLFKPDAGPGPNIFVPLRLVTWQIHSSATLKPTGWSVDTGNPVAAPSDANCTAFPDWTKTYGGGWW